MLKVWKWYQNCLSVNPVKTQIISSGFLWGIGDIAAQYITHATAKNRLQISETKLSFSCTFNMIFDSGKSGTNDNALFYFLPKCASPPSFSHLNGDADEKFKINWKRVATTSMFGFGFVGPIGHFWYEGLDKFIRLKLQLPPKSVRFVATKVATDCIIFGPLDLFVFFSYMGFSAGKNVTQVKEDVKRDFIPALILEGGVWPIVQVANFRYVPVRYQLLYVNIFCLLDSAFLSWVEQQKDASWKQWFPSYHSLEEKSGKGDL
ncbi:hypothetical protein Patl1_13257 [Pistacia atlantica]|uniref:Uncharacterized protein n=1 Tax=Pistacia atlantica TaxID=434234 RepID=A0ACC1AW04_9ROSI|nr:hypothetical protein Patl1_13257 [Pistacia atlantica]